MKRFQKQFSECCRDELCIPGDVLKFKDNPNLLPPLWHVSANKIFKKFKTNPDLGLTPMRCVRFGGQCHSKKEECIKFRRESI